MTSAQLAELRFALRRGARLIVIDADVLAELLAAYATQEQTAPPPDVAIIATSVVAALAAT